MHRDTRLAIGNCPPAWVRHDDPLAVLSAREREVLALMAEGRSNALVEGIDSSPEMIAAAADVPGVSFSIGNAADWQPAGDVDVIVSNAALQWVPRHQQLMTPVGVGATGLTIEPADAVTGRQQALEAPAGRRHRPPPRHRHTRVLRQRAAGRRPSRRRVGDHVSSCTAWPGPSAGMDARDPAGGHCLPRCRRTMPTSSPRNSPRGCGRLTRQDRTAHSFRSGGSSRWVTAFSTETLLVA
jgi:hypothetical protein